MIANLEVRKQDRLVAVANHGGRCVTFTVSPGIAKDFAGRINQEVIRPGNSRLLLSGEE